MGVPLTAERRRLKLIVTVKSKGAHIAPFSLF
jgi:hypothetical protein